MAKPGPCRGGSRHVAARTGLSLHRDGREVYTGAYTFFVAPQWDIHWGGLLIVLDKRTQLAGDVVELYGQGKSIKNVWLDRERETELAFNPGLGQVVDGDRRPQARRRAATPGRSLPSSHSRKAPPAVET